LKIFYFALTTTRLYWSDSMFLRIIPGRLTALETAWLPWSRL